MRTCGCPLCSKHWTKQPHQVGIIIIDRLLPARQSFMNYKRYMDIIVSFLFFSLSFLSSSLPHRFGAYGAWLESRNSGAGASSFNSQLPHLLWAWFIPQFPRL